MARPTKRVKSNFKEDFNTEILRTMPKLNIWAKRIYTWAFNIYAWFWIYRQIFIKHSTDWEEYLLWFFTTIGMYFFVLDSRDMFFKENQMLDKKA